MKGDIIIPEEHHRKVARTIVSHLIGKIMNKPTRYTLSVAGESGSGKSETALAITDELRESGIKSVVLAQDDYFYLPDPTI
jgi:uridine kinase